MDNITISLQDLKAVITSIISDERIDKILQRPQLSFTESCRLYGEHRIRKYIKSGLLKPASKNGSGSITYYSHKKIIELTQKSFHHLNEFKI
ncbi:hypothetical protein ORI89_17545 [Sphingobacterium sp. UT-1RO-CII-1]|uniref:hypothetical protein n=1 Tax=Sphingobacterium sp. UT-1RO-CII-1 TaxID=2995225 RepID=UPI00227AFCBA|nr:hypothetical protein [Sphingobacterium sp. UT-1RO-CII-1]MCY4781465.1 hypothetical protein [Sphingobacterium sp. UT-1RO-CII-1]